MTDLILFGIGSPIIIDVEDSAYRAGHAIRMGIKNHPSPSYLGEDALVVTLENVPRDLLHLPFLLPLFTPGHRQSAAKEARQIGLTQPFTLIDPSVVVPRQLQLGPGGYINVGCSLGGGSTFGEFTFINRSASVGHHAKVGSFVSVGPGAVIAGGVTIGSGTVVLTGATILPGISIGENSVVAAGSVVTKDVPSACLVAGNPARVVSRDAGGYKGLSV